jgi:hypothetical protein
MIIWKIPAITKAGKEPLKPSSSKSLLAGNAIMTPIQDLLHRIRWDPEFSDGEFVIGYCDRIQHEIILAPFLNIMFPKDAPGVFELIPFRCTGSSRFIRTAS